MAFKVVSVPVVWAGAKAALNEASTQVKKIEDAPFLINESWRQQSALSWRVPQSGQFLFVVPAQVATSSRGLLQFGLRNAGERNADCTDAAYPYTWQANLMRDRYAKPIPDFAGHQDTLDFIG